MSEPMKVSETTPSSRRRSWLICASAFAIVLGVAVAGIVSRVGAKAALSSAAQESAIPAVTVVRAEAPPAVEDVILPGQVKGLSETPIYARASGYVRSWKADIGAQVAGGDLLAEIDAPEVDQQLRQAEADLKTAQANAAAARETADRVQGLVATLSVSRQEGEDRAATAAATASVVASNQANVERLRRLAGFKRVTAPYAGIITARETDVGNLINAGSGLGPELFRIADIRRLRVYVQAPQAYARLIRPGVTAELIFPEQPGRPFAASVVRTAGALDPQNRSLLVELEVDNADRTLLPGSFTQVHFNLPTAGKGLPRLAGNTLLFRAEGLRIAVVGTDSKVTLKPVTLGRDFGPSVEIASGLSAGDRVVVNPPAALQTGDSVRISTPSPSKPVRS